MNERFLHISKYRPRLNSGFGAIPVSRIFVSERAAEIMGSCLRMKLPVCERHSTECVEVDQLIAVKQRKRTQTLWLVQWCLCLWSSQVSPQTCLSQAHRSLHEGATLQPVAREFISQMID
jgi:hypothetical protein